MHISVNTYTHKLAYVRHVCFLMLPVLVQSRGVVYPWWASCITPLPPSSLGPAGALAAGSCRQ